MGRVVSMLPSAVGTMPLVTMGFGSLIGSWSGDERSRWRDRRYASVGFTAAVSESLPSEGRRDWIESRGNAEGQSVFRGSSRDESDAEEKFRDSLLGRRKARL